MLRPLFAFSFPRAVCTRLLFVALALCDRAVAAAVGANPTGAPVTPTGKPAEICVAPLNNNKPFDGPMMHAESRVYDFGFVVKGVSVRHAFALYNYGTKPLEILDVRTAGGCVADGEWTRTIQPGNSGTIPIRLNSDQLSGPMAQTITVISNDPMRPQGTLEIRGVVRLPVSLSSPVATFPAVIDPASPLTCAITIRHEVEGALRVEPPSIDRPFFKALLKETVPGREFELRISTAPSLDPGTHTARIELKTSDPTVPVLAVQATVTVLPAVQIVPAELSLPAGKLAMPETRHVVVLNRRAGELAVSDLAVDAPGVEVTTQRNPDGRQFTLTLIFPAGFDAHVIRPLRLSGQTNHASVATFTVPIVAGAR